MFTTKSIFGLNVLAIASLFSTATAQTATSTTTAVSTIVTPTPTQPEMVDNCDAFYEVQPGDYCSLIAAETSITLAEFYTYNPGVGSDCSALALDHWVCVAA
ncbi:unnamed protein product [Discula destructiva]